MWGERGLERRGAATGGGDGAQGAGGAGGHAAADRGRLRGSFLLSSRLRRQLSRQGQSLCSSQARAL